MTATVIYLSEWRDRQQVKVTFDPFWVWYFYWTFWWEVCRVPGAR